MNHRSAALTLSFTAHTVAVVALLVMAGVSPSLAQQKAKKAAAAAAKPATSAKPVAAPAKPDAPKVAAQPGLIYSPWTKICSETGGPNAKPAERKRLCLTAKEARLETGLPAAGVALVEPDKEAKKLRVSLPLGMQLPPGTRIVIDQNPPMTSPYLICLGDGCIAEYDATSDLIGRLKKGKQLAIQAIDATGQAIAINVPLDDFAKVVDGRPTDMSAFEAEQRKRAEDLRRRINEAREFVARAQAQPGSQGAPQSGPPAR